MVVKLFEVRDRATFIPVFAFRTRPSMEYLPTDIGRPVANERERYLLARAGFSPIGDSPLVMFGRLEASGTSYNCTYDKFAWGGKGSRTMQVAHGYVEEHFDELESGAVIDVEFILGETTKPKESEQWA